MNTRNPIIDVAEANTVDYATHEELARRLTRLFGYSRDQMIFEHAQDDSGELNPNRLRIVIHKHEM